MTRPLPAGTWGLAINGSNVVIAQGLSAEDRCFALAHELGHVLVRRGRLCVPPGFSEEWLCDMWALDLLVPEQVAPQRSDRAIAKELGVHPVAVAAQRVRGAAAEAYAVRDGRVACWRCGIRPHMPRCGCLARRRDKSQKGRTKRT